MVDRIQPTQINPSGDRAGQDGERTRKAGTSGPPGAAGSPAEPAGIVTWSDGARNVTGVQERRSRGGSSSTVFESAKEAAAAANDLQKLLRSHAGRATQAQGVANADRVWNLVTD